MFLPTVQQQCVLVITGVLTMISLGPRFRSIASAERPERPFPESVQSGSSKVDFFEARIRPVLIEHCYECHSEQNDDAGGSLWLDSADAMARGGESGPAIQPGDADASLLMSAIRYESSEMPPSGRLPDHVIDDFETWIRDGAADPRDGGEIVRQTNTPASIDLEQGRKFWAFQPIRPNSHVVTAEATSSSDSWIDAYLDRELANAGLKANADATVDSQLRRLALDLTGLPPDDAMMSTWRSDPTDRNWAQMIDRLLASPGYAEHWARHEMDLARYADSNGGDFNATYHDAWRYRDYLVRSIADDLPIDQWIRQQIAGDLLPYHSPQQRHDQLVATTFLMLGTKMLSERDKSKLTMDVVDEQIDTVGRAFMGMTLGCARCHDHKFDPIPTEDYYALAGIFRSTRSLDGESQEYVSTWTPTPLPASASLVESHRRHRSEIAQFKESIDSVRRDLRDLDNDRRVFDGIMIDDEEAIQDGVWMSSTSMPGFIGKGYVHDHNRDKGNRSIVFETALPSPGDGNAGRLANWEIRLWYAPGSTRANEIPATINIGENADKITFSEKHAGQEVTSVILGRWKAAYGSPVRVEISNQNTSGYVVVDALQIRLFNDDKLISKSAQIDASTASRESKLMETRLTLERKLKRLQSQMAKWIDAAPEPLPHAMAVADRDADQRGDCAVHIRGEVNNLGESVPRGFLQVCGGGSSVSVGRTYVGSETGANTQAGASSPWKSSGRLELAQWLTDPDHPLTSRVAVNRIWMHLMGEGIVRTVDNFGSRGQRPTHPELLDALAIELVQQGWSRKALIRQIVSTRAYRRSSDLSAKAIASDPENRWWWRAQRRRLPAESIRDAMLMISGTLDRSARDEPMKGMGVLVSKNDANSQANLTVGLSDPKRTIYLPVIRGEIPTLLATLDAADPDLLVGKRPTTNVPAQALALIGSDEVRQWAAMTVERLFNEAGVQAIAGEDRNAFTEFVYQRVLQRAARPSDHALVDAWMNSPTALRMSDDRSRWREWIAAMFAGTEFRFLD